MTQIRLRTGIDVTDQADAITGLTDQSPSYEELQEATDAAAGFSQRQQDVETYEEEVLAPTEDCLNDPDNPYSTDELDEIRDNLRAPMPADVAAECETAAAPTPRAGSAAEQYVDDTDLGSVRLGREFRTAQAGNDNPLDDGYDLDNLPKLS